MYLLNLQKVGKGKKANPAENGDAKADQVCWRRQAVIAKLHSVNVLISIQILRAKAVSTLRFLIKSVNKLFIVQLASGK